MVINEEAFEKALNEVEKDESWQRFIFFEKLDDKYADKFNEFGNEKRQYVMERIIAEPKRFSNIYYHMVWPYASKYCKFWQKVVLVNDDEYDDCGYDVDGKYLLDSYCDDAEHIHKVREDEVIPHNFDYPKIKLYGPNNVILCYCHNDMELNDVLTQIKNKHLKGWYIIQDEKRINIE